MQVNTAVNTITGGILSMSILARISLRILVLGVGLIVNISGAQSVPSGRHADASPGLQAVHMAETPDHPGLLQANASADHALPPMPAPAAAAASAVPEPSAAPALSRPPSFRDPFLQPRSESGQHSYCLPGKSCISVEDITLQGVIRSGDRAMAVVLTGDNQVYFLHEQDGVRNGRVAKIGTDSVTFHIYPDGDSRKAARDIVRKLTGAPDA